jgi:hypothetical protein
VISETETGGRLRSGDASPVITQRAFADESDPDPARAVFAAFGRLAITLHDPPGMQRVLIIADRAEWLEAAQLLTVRATREFALRIIAVRKQSRRMWSVRDYDLWGSTWYGFTGDID